GTRGPGAYCDSPKLEGGECTMIANAVEHSTAANSPAALVNLDRYPLLDLASPAAQDVVRWARGQLARTGACELPDFLNASGLAAIVADSRALAPAGYRRVGSGTAYLEVPEDALPADHPRRYIGPYATGVIAYDMFPPASPLRRLYEWDVLMEFIGTVLQRQPLYRYADPLGALNLAVMTAG